MESKQICIQNIFPSVFLSMLHKLTVLQKNLKYMQNKRLSWLFILILFVLCLQSGQCGSTSPIWVASSFFKAGSINFAFTSGLATQNGTITYSSAIVNSSLKIPTLGITDIDFTISSGRIYLLIQVVQFTATMMKFQVEVATISYLSLLKMTFMALDNSFTPAFSMNFFFPNVNQNSSNISAQYYINFTQSTGVTLNTSHENVLLPFMHYIDCTTYDSTININLNFTVLNASFYTVIITSSSKMSLQYAGFSRLIFDKTAIEALGNDYFSYGIISSNNNNNTALTTTIPPTIIPSNLFYGMNSFTISSGLSCLNYTSSYVVQSGILSFTSHGSYHYSNMKFSYMHHKTRTCPSSYPYYNISQQLCYNQCNVGWYADSPTKTCKKCLYDCYTCTNGTACASCNITVDFRIMSNHSRCVPISGYYDSNTNATIAGSCTSPCTSCTYNATNCMSCIAGYYANLYTCLLCSLAIPYCLNCNSNNFCIQCLDNSNGSSCTPCTSSQYLNPINNTCIDCSIMISNCKACESSNLCTYCQSTFTLFNESSCVCTPTQYQYQTEGAIQCFSCSDSMAYCYNCTSPMNCISCFSTFTLVNASSCICNSTSFVNATSMQCQQCSIAFLYCITCLSSGCTLCDVTFIVNSGDCECPSGYYLNENSSSCLSCSIAIQNCVTCYSNFLCQTCGSGFQVNSTSGLCEIILCIIINCYSCVSHNYQICSICDSGYSLTYQSTNCSIICGDDNVYHPTEQCDDGNLNNGDGCSSTCQIESEFTCLDQYVNMTQIFSACYYTGNITFDILWIRKIEGYNGLKFLFQLNQQIDQWSSMNFASIASFDFIDTSTNFTLGMSQEMIQSCIDDYDSNTNRFSLTIEYTEYSLQQQWINVALQPYNFGYPAFTPPPNVEFFPPTISIIFQIKANNNQNSNLYSDAQYKLYQTCLIISYFIVGTTLFTIAASLIFCTGNVISFQMLTVVQLTYFSLAFLDSINPVFAGLLPLRYIAGILNLRNIEDYLYEFSSPNNMKGIYMFLDLSSNFKVIAITLLILLVVGGLLFAIYLLVDYFGNCRSLVGDRSKSCQRKGFIIYKIAIHILGELPISMILACLPLYTISLFFEVLYTAHDTHFWSYAQAVGVGIVILAYFMALIKSKYIREGECNHVGEYMSQFYAAPLFSSLKYTNLIMLEIAIISGLAVVCIYTNSKLFCAFCIIFVCFVDIVTVAIIKPYKYGFISWWKGENNDTETVLQKIQLYKIYDEQLPSAQINLTKKSGENENGSDVFTQHFASRINIIKSKHQGLIQAGHILNQPKLFLFNNNVRRIVNLVTIILVEFIVICTKLFANSINIGYNSVNIIMLLPFAIQISLLINFIYNGCFLILQIMNRTKQSSNQVENDPDSSSQLVKSIYTTNIMKKEVNVEAEQSISIPPPVKSSKTIQQNNAEVKSMYNLKRPQILHPTRMTNRRTAKKLPQEQAYT